MLRRCWIPAFIGIVAVSGIVMTVAGAWTAWVSTPSVIDGGTLPDRRWFDLIEPLSFAIFVTSFIIAVVGWISFRWRDDR